MSVHVYACLGPSLARDGEVYEASVATRRFAAAALLRPRVWGAIIFADSIVNQSGLFFTFVPPLFFIILSTYASLPRKMTKLLQPGRKSAKLL